MKILKMIVGMGVLCFIGVLISCNDSNELVDPFDPLAQLEEDIALIEEYLSENGFTDYDTLDTGIRLVILEEGTGESIEFNDNIQFDYIGKLLTDVVFRTSIAQVAYDQDLENLTDSVQVKDNNGAPVLDSNGLQELDGIEFTEGYFPVYYKTPADPFGLEITTHSLGGWFIQSNPAPPFARIILGLPAGIHEIFTQTNIGGRGMVLIPSTLAFGPDGSQGIDSNSSVIFEIRPVRKR